MARAARGLASVHGEPNTRVAITEAGREPATPVLAIARAHAAVENHGAKF